jgi:hypothetical protein
MNQLRAFGHLLLLQTPLVVHYRRRLKTQNLSQNHGLILQNLLKMV